MKRVMATVSLVVGAVLVGSCDRSTPPAGPSFDVQAGMGVDIYPRYPTPGWDVVTPSCKDYTATVYDGLGNPVGNPWVVWTIGDGRVAYFSNNSGSQWAGQGPAHVCGMPQGQNQGYGYTDLSALWTAPDNSYAVETVLIENGQTTAGYAPATLTVSPASANLMPGASVQLSAEGRDQFNHTRTEHPVWSSGSPSIATVTSDGGLVTAVAYGSATITADVNGSTRGVPITVLGAASMTVSPSTVSMCWNGGASLNATVRDQNGNPWTGGVVAWASGDSSKVRVVGRSGGARIADLVGLSVGQAVVTGSFSGATGPLSGTSTVTVSDCAPVAGVSGPYSLPMYTSGRFTATASLGVPPYTYEFRLQNCPQFGPCSPYQNWVARGSTNYWDTVVYNCGTYRINVQSRVTESRGFVSGPSSPWTTSISNVC